MTWLTRSAVVAAVLGCLTAGCSRPSATVLGAAPSGTPQSSTLVRSAAEGTPVVLHGEMVEKCPAAGCWFELKDQEGVVRVDTKLAGFNVTDVPLHTVLTVAGKAEGKGNDRFVDATGLRY